MSSVYARATVFLATPRSAASARLEGKAVNEVAKLKTGEKVMLTYRDNTSGEHLAVTNIQPAKSTSKK